MMRERHALPDYYRRQALQRHRKSEGCDKKANQPQRHVEIVSQSERGLFALAIA
jgi:hypothetical protein